MQRSSPSSIRGICNCGPRMSAPNSNDRRAAVNYGLTVGCRLTWGGYLAPLAAFWPDKGAQCHHVLRITEQHFSRSPEDGERAESWPLGVSSGSYPDLYRVMNVSGGSTDCRARQFTDLFGRYYSPVLAYARRRVGADLAQDVVAETFLAAWRNLDDLPPRPLPWLYRTANFAVANQRRTLARRGRLHDRARLLLPGSDVAHDHSELIAADMELAAAFRSLSEADREVLRLAAWEGLAVAAIGTVLGCSAVAAKARLYRARQRLSRKLGADRHEPREQAVQPTALKEAQQ